MPPVETITAVLIVLATLIVLSVTVAIILAPRKIRDDVMLQAFGDAPHVEREG